MSFFNELQRRNVVRVGVAYIVTAWLLLQVSDTVMESIGAPEWVMQALLFMLVVCVFPVLAFSWVYELTPEGIKRETVVSENESIVLQTRRKLDWLIIVLLLGVVGYQYWSANFRAPPEAAPETASSTSQVLDSAATDPVSLDSTQRSIAVLPFVNLSSDPEQEYFSDGISEELLNVLAQIDELRVAARTSSFLFKEGKRPISEIAELLNVKHVLEGSVRKAGSRLRITAQLIEADSGYHLWSETYDRELTDVFAIQDEISQAIAEALSIELALGSPALASSGATGTDPEVYDLYLRGRELASSLDEAKRAEGIDLLNQAISVAPDFAPARAELVVGIALASVYGGSLHENKDVYRITGDHVAELERLDVELPELWYAKAMRSWAIEDWESVLAHANRALELRPSYAAVYRAKADAFEGLQRHEERVEALEKWLKIDPLSVQARRASALALGWTDPERAEKLAQSLMSDSPYLALRTLAVVVPSASRKVEYALRILEAAPDDPWGAIRLLSGFSWYLLNNEALRFVSPQTEAFHFMNQHQYAEAEVGFRRAMQQNQVVREVKLFLAFAIYNQGRFDESVEFFRDAVVETAVGPTLQFRGGDGSWSLVFNAVMIHALREQGLYEEADQIARTTRLIFDSRDRAYGTSAHLHSARAAFAAAQGDFDQAVAHQTQAVQSGYDDIRGFDWKLYDALRGNPEFEAARAGAQANQDRNREEILTLICENNPIPDTWQPLASTCAGR